MRVMEFKQWLTEKGRYKDHSLNDKVSQCRRIEKILNISLDKLTVKHDLNEAVSILRKETMSEKYSSFTRSHLNKALTLYYEFYQS